MGANLSQEEIDALLKGTDDQEPLKEKTALPAASARRRSAPVMPVPQEVDAPKPDTQPQTQFQEKAPSVRPAVFAEFPESAPLETPVAGMEVLLDVPLSISVELGRARCFVRDLLNLSVGSVVELDKAAGESVDVLVNGKVFAHGEVVVVDENFGVRIGDIVAKNAPDRGLKKITQ